MEISVPGGAKIAERTLNARLGILGGLSILGTTGIVTPFSCAAWIASIHRGIDVARATGLEIVAGATGSTSEAAIKALYALPEEALIDMGDFVGGMLKYLRKHPVRRVVVAGGMAKMTKLAQGLLDLHSKRGSVDLDFLAGFAQGETAGAIRAANSAKHAFEIAQGAASTLRAPWRRPHGEPPPRRCMARRANWKSWCSTATAACWRRPDFARSIDISPLIRPPPSRPGEQSRRDNAGGNRDRRARSRGSRLRPAPARQGSARCAPSGCRAVAATMVASVACTIRSSGQLARNTSAIGQSGP